MVLDTTIQQTNRDRYRERRRVADQFAQVIEPAEGSLAFNTEITNALIELGNQTEHLPIGKGWGRAVKAVAPDAVVFQTIAGRGWLGVRLVAQSQ